MKIIAITLCCFISINTFAKNFGVVGDVYEVKERSLLALIEARLHDMDLDSFRDAIKKRIEAHIVRPNPLPLARGTTTIHHYYEPKIVLGFPLLDAKGRVIFPKGATVNALTKMPWYQPFWIFIDADDKAQTLWALEVLKQHPDAKLILTKGAINDAEAIFKRPIYFDQEGRITKKIKITQVPSIVKRINDALLIKSPKILENGHED